jgi:hypothetical protein
MKQFLLELKAINRQLNQMPSRLVIKKLQQEMKIADQINQLIYFAPTQGETAEASSRGSSGMGSLAGSMATGSGGMGMATMGMGMGSGASVPPPKKASSSKTLALSAALFGGGRAAGAAAGTRGSRMEAFLASHSPQEILNQFSAIKSFFLKNSLTRFNPNYVAHEKRLEGSRPETEQRAKMFSSLFSSLSFTVRSRKEPKPRAIHKRYIQMLEINTMLKLIEEISLRKTLKNILFEKDFKHKDYDEILYPAADSASYAARARAKREEERVTTNMGFIDFATVY